MYNFLENNEISVPLHISIWGVLSGSCFLFTSIISYRFQWYYLGYHSFALYLTTIAHWSYPRKKGLIRNLDILTATTINLYGAYETYFLAYNYQIMWYSSFFIMTLIFLFNEDLYYHQITKYEEKNITNNKLQFIDTIIITVLPNNRYFSITPTKPGTKEREYAYYRSAFTHIFFTHFFSQIATIYCIINNKSIFLE